MDASRPPLRLASFFLSVSLRFFMQEEEATTPVNDSFDRIFKKESHFYDDFITGRVWYTRLINRVFFHQRSFLASADLVFKMLPQDLKGKVLDVPCGTGALTKELYLAYPQVSFTCLDYSENMISCFKQALAKEARPASHISFQQGDVACLPYKDETFDLVISMNGYQCFPQKDAALQEMRRVLKQGGLLVGSAYRKGAYLISDLVVRLYDKKGIMSGPHETETEFKAHLEKYFKVEKYEAMGTSVHFCCSRQ